MESLKTQIGSWIKDQSRKIGIQWPPPLPQARPNWNWPPWKGRDDRKEKERILREEFENHKKKLNDLCVAVKAESLSDLQEILCSMVLSECVYKRPPSEMLRFINKFKTEFGGQIISLERVQPSLDHVPHRYLLAEAGDTLYASFIGTKQYKDFIADVNIFQGALFHDDDIPEDSDEVDGIEGEQVDIQKNEKSGGKIQIKKSLKPAAHRGFLARAKGIPALELYKLAVKKNRKLVLCGHSLGGAVAALATLAILRVLASAPLTKEHEKVQVKCITFSQPPVGNAALKDYVYQKGWHQYFKTYCIPEDLVPRILSPAYFHHYNSSQTVRAFPDSRMPTSNSVKSEVPSRSLNNATVSKEKKGEQLVLGVGPVQKSVWRLYKLVPLDAVRKHVDIFRKGNGAREAAPVLNRGVKLPLKVDEIAESQSLEIQEGAEGISLNTVPIKEDEGINEVNGNLADSKNSAEAGNSRQWRRVPGLPSYVPFGELYLLESSSVKSLSDAEYSKITSVKSVISELKERLQSHSMKSYRSRFQRIYDQFMLINAPKFLGIDQFPYLQKWLGLSVIGAVELGHIVDPPIIRTATSIVPLGWNGVPNNKNSDPLKVDIVGHGLHLCTLVQAQVNGKWCSTVVESLPSAPPHTSNNDLQPVLQKMRVFIGAPLKHPPKYPVTEEYLQPMFSSEEVECFGSDLNCVEENRSSPEGLGDFSIYCTSDFITASKKVHIRTRRVRFLGFEGAGKTSLFKAILDHSRQRNNAMCESLYPEADTREETVNGVCYIDSTGVNLQELHLESTRFREELQAGTMDLNKKTDLIVLVHNLSQKIPLYNQSNISKRLPALSILLHEAKSLSIPYILAITNKFSVSANQQNKLVTSAMEAYEATPNVTQVVNSCPFVIPTVINSVQSNNETIATEKENLNWAQRMIQAPLSFAPIYFQNKPVILPVQGIGAFRQLVHSVLRSQEESAFEELANERLSIELAREHERSMNAKQDAREKGTATTAAAVGASVGAGLGVVLAIVLGAASALRKP